MYGVHNHFPNGIEKGMNDILKYSMCKPVHFSQNKFWKVLKSRLDKEDMQFTEMISNNKYSPLLFNHNYISHTFRDGDYKIEVSAMDEKTQNLKTIYCKYLIGWEGVRSKIRESIGGELIGTFDIVNWMNIHFRSKQLSESIKRKNLHAMLYFIYNSKHAGILINHNLEEGEFVLHQPYFVTTDKLRELKLKEHVKNILEWINSESDNWANKASYRDIQWEVTNIDQIWDIGFWKLSACSSNIFGDHINNVFIAGDAGHSVPPTGGYGMNSGIVDAYNLTHKIADSEFHKNNKILKDYNTERKFMNRLVAEFAHRNFNKGDKIMNPSGFSLKTITDTSKAYSDYTPNIIPKSLSENIKQSIMSTFHFVLHNPISIDNKLKQLKEYKNGIGLIFPNLDFSYTYPIDSKGIMKTTEFLEENYDNQNYIIVNSVGSLLPLFDIWWPYKNKVYASREYIYLYQFESKLPYYFLFKFNAKDESTSNIEWLEGDQDMIREIISNRKDVNSSIQSDGKVSTNSSI